MTHIRRNDLLLDDTLLIKFHDQSKVVSNCMLKFTGYIAFITVNLKVENWLKKFALHAAQTSAARFSFSRRTFFTIRTQVSGSSANAVKLVVKPSVFA